jgi:hypothetical protein
MRPHPQRLAGSPGGRLAANRGLTSPGFRLIVPGWGQLAWGQVDRAVAHLGSFLAALATALFAWGTWLGWVFLGIAIVWHLVSAQDALRQRAFPAFSERIALSALGLTIGLTVYLPLSALLWFCAWPARADRVSDAGYLVNRLAYRHDDPVPGQWIWIRSAPSRTPTSGQVLAVGGQEVECTGRRWRVDGREVQLPFPGPATDYPDGWRFQVPEGHVLIGPATVGAKSEFPSPLLIVARDQIIGRAWARYYPLWDRCLL